MEYRDAFDPDTRPFQGRLVNAVLNRYAAGEKVTVALVWCGSGKTIAYQAAATHLMRVESQVLARIKYVLVYVPRVTLARQAELGYRAYLYDEHGRKVVDPSTVRPAELGSFAMFDPACRLEWLYHRSNKAPLLPPGHSRVGLVSTYQSLVTDCGKPEQEGGGLHLQWARAHHGEFLLVADEAQYCGAQDGEDDLSSPAAGQYVSEMAEYAGHVLLLTATADRADGRKLVLCDDRYKVGRGGRLFLDADVTAGYSEGISFGYLRQFDAAIVDAGIRLASGVEYDLSMASEQPPGERAALAAILRDPEVWKPLCDLAVKRLRSVKRLNKAHRALIACMRMDDAEKVVAYLAAQYPELRVALAISKHGEKALAALEDFKSKPYDVLVTVRMAFIGYDCPEITVVGVLTNYRDLGHLTQLVFRGGRVWRDGGTPASQRLHLIVPDDQAMGRFIAYLRLEQAKGLSQRGPGGDSPDGTAAELASAWTTDIRGATNEDDIDAGDYAAFEADLDEFGPILTPADLRAYWERKITQNYEQAEDAPLDRKESKPHAPGDQPNRGATVPKTNGQGAADDRGAAAKAIGRFLRQHGWKPEDRGYKRARGILTSQINDAFAVRSAEDITTAEEAEKYLAHVKSHLARLNEEGWQ